MSKWSAAVTGALLAAAGGTALMGRSPVPLLAAAGLWAVVTVLAAWDERAPRH